MLFAQQTSTAISGHVVDQEGQSLSYVNIGIVGTATGTVSDESGQFTLYIKSSIIEDELPDTIRFSMIGYADQNYNLNQLTEQKEKLRVVLAQRSFDLEEVIVRPAFKNFITKGKTKTSTKRNVNFAISSRPRQNLGTEIGKRFKVKNKTTQIEKIKFYIAKNNFDTARFRVQVYKTKKGKPGDHLNHEDIIIDVLDKKTGWVEFDLSDYQLTTQKDFIISLQWIDHSSNGKILAMPIIFPSFGGNHYYKFGSQDRWKRFKNMSTNIQVVMAY